MVKFHADNEKEMGILCSEIQKKNLLHQQHLSFPMQRVENGATE